MLLDRKDIITEKYEKIKGIGYFYFVGVCVMAL